VGGFFGIYNSIVKSIVGQNKAVQTLGRALNNHRRHHAWIFSGPMGVGKCTTAKKFGLSLLGEEHSGNTKHQDLHIVCKEDVVWSNNPSLQKRKQTNIPLDLLRERIIGGVTSDGKYHDSVAFKTPTKGRHKVFIIDEAELLDETGQNALLKTLEEPPPETTLILVTSREDLLLPTVRSRCQPVPFSPLDDRSMKQWSSGCGIRATPEDFSWSVLFSGGSPGLVCEAIDTGLPGLADSISGFLSLRGGGGYVDVHTKLFGFIEANVATWIKQNPNTSKEAANRRAMCLVLRMFSLSVQQLIRGQREVEGVGLAGILVDIEQQLSTNISMKVLIESLAARWAHGCVGDALLV
jgi:DNA polymerase-3 subunit delta'